MIRIRDIVQITVIPKDSQNQSLALRCHSGKLKWISASKIFSLTVNIIDDQPVFDEFVDFMSSNQPPFFIEATSRANAEQEQATVRFICYKQEVFEFRSATIGPVEPSTTRYYFSALAELDGAMNEQK